MKGPLNRLRRRPSTATPPPETPAGDAPTQAHDAVDPQAALPAGQAPADGAPSFRHRGAMRRRLRYLRRARELGFRDLGGLVFDQHRFGRPNEELVQAKVGALSAVDRELRTLEHALRDERPVTELREAGVSVCARCGALMASDARFCASCGTPQRGARTIAPVGEAPAPQTLEPAPAPAEQPTAVHEATPAEQQ